MNYSTSRWRQCHTYLKEVLSIVPLQCGGDKCSGEVNTVPSAVLLVIAGQDDLVVPSDIDADAIVCERVCMVEIEDEEETSTFKYDYFVALRVSRVIRSGCKGTQRGT